MKRSAALLLIGFACGSAGAQDQDKDLEIGAHMAATQHAIQSIYTKLLEQHADAMVNVDYVLTMRFMGQTSDQDGSATGVMVSADGLILLTRSLVQPDLGSFSGPDSNFAPPQLEARDFRVTVPASGEAFDARLVARDPALDLMWIRLQETGDAEFAHVDFSESGDFSPGQAVYSIDRLSAWFGYAAYVQAGNVIGETTIPRRFGILAFAGSSGAVFDSEGRVLGLVVNPRDTDGDADHVGWMTMDMIPRPFLLPGDLVDRANREAMEAAAASE
jgi:hypothetical protein